MEMRLEIQESTGEYTLIKESVYTRCICVFKQTCLQDVKHLCLIYIDKNCVNDEVFFVYAFYHHVMSIKKQITHTHLSLIHISEPTRHA